MPLFERYNLESPATLLAELTTERDAARSRFSMLTGWAGNASATWFEDNGNEIANLAERSRILEKMIGHVDSFHARPCDWSAMIGILRHSITEEVFAGTRRAIDKPSYQMIARAAEAAKIAEKFGALEVLEGRKR